MRCSSLALLLLPFIDQSYIYFVMFSPIYSSLLFLVTTDYLKYFHLRNFCTARIWTDFWVNFTQNSCIGESVFQKVVWIYKSFFLLLDKLYFFQWNWALEKPRTLAQVMLVIHWDTVQCCFEIYLPFMPWKSMYMLSVINKLPCVQNFLEVLTLPSPKYPLSNKP